jgi:preprotein translocase subunit SecE
VVYCGGLENRFRRKPDGGSNPSLSAKKILFVSNTEIIILAVVIGGVFGLLWWQGQLQRIAVYVQETREELKKCSWPTWDELKGSTLLIAIAIVLMGIFTFVMDQILIFIFIKH